MIFGGPLDITLYLIPGIIVGVPLLWLLSLFFKQHTASESPWLRVLRFSVQAYVMLLAPAFFLAGSDSGDVVGCCGNETFFSPQHRASVYVLMLLTELAYFYSSTRKSAGPPLLDVLVNITLLLGFALNFAVALHLALPPKSYLEVVLVLLGNVPIAGLIITALARNHQKTRAEALPSSVTSGVFGFLTRLLLQPMSVKLPLLVLGCAPLLALFSSILRLFGQEQDSLVKAFTDTYQHGLSTPDFPCDESTCKGHYLCTIAARGHRQVVRPLRYGTRAGRIIICNRQLLVANAFEQILEERVPRVHSWVRRHYDRIGRYLGRHHHVFKNPFVSDLVFVAMKPLEWVFLTVLYLHDSAPEQRIQRQYLPANAASRVPS